MSLYFEPVLPDESADTVRTTVLNSELTKSWIVSREIPLITSNLNEIECENENKKFNFLSFQSKKCQAKGDDAEKLFLNLCAKRGWTQKYVENYEQFDYAHHVDAMIKIGNKEIWVDVKCMRSLRRGWKPQSEYMWVELHSSGWLFGGKANVIAQQITEDSFALFDKELLAQYVKSVVDVKKPVVPYAEQSYLRVYIRETKGKVSSVLSLINTSDAFQHAGCGILR